MIASRPPRPLAVSESFANPYYGPAMGSFAAAGTCGLIALLATALWDGGFAATIVASVAAGGASVLLVCGLVFVMMARLAQPRVDGLAGDEAIASWTFSAATWNAFVERMRFRHVSSPTVPRSLPPVIGLAVCPTLAIVGLGGAIPLVLLAAGLVTWTIIRLERKHGLKHYPLVDRPVRVVISRHALATPGGVFVWNTVGPRLVTIALNRREELVFQVVTLSCRQTSHAEIIVPVPCDRRPEARQLVMMLRNRPLAQLVTAATG